MLSPTFFIICDICGHTKLVSQGLTILHRVLIDWRLQIPDPEHVYLQSVSVCTEGSGNIRLIIKLTSKHLILLCSR